MRAGGNRGATAAVGGSVCCFAHWLQATLVPITEIIRSVCYVVGRFVRDARMEAQIAGLDL
jgi:hypothetical protein